MTENEALRELNLQSQVLKSRIQCNREIEEFVSTAVLEYKKDAIDMAIQALEEIQQYRAIGTPTQIYEKIGGLDVELGKYHSIGTIEEFKALKEKSVAKKPIMIGYRKDGEPVYECGCCGSTLKVDDQPFCMFCSCKIDWSTDKEETTQTIGYADQSGLMSAT